VIRGKFGISISANHICCDNQNCKEKLIGMAGGKMPEILPLKFWVLDYFSYRSDQRAIANLFRKLFGLEERLTREKAFEFFKR